MEIAKKAEYDWAWCTDHEKAYFSPWKYQFLWSKFFGEKLKWKQFL